MNPDACHPHIRTMPLMAALDDEAFAAVMQEAECRHIAKGAPIFSTGEPADRFYMICDGRAKIYQLAPDGREQILYVYRTGEFIGGLNLLMAQNYLYMGAALEKIRVLVIPASVFHRFMVDNAKVLRVLLEQSFERIRWAEALIDRLSRHTAEMKTAALLLRLVRDIGVPAENGFDLTLTMNREELGSYAGLTRESITRTLNSFRTMGYIAWTNPRTIRVIAVDRLQRILDN